MPSFACATPKWDGAYYLLGYCIECALKACVAKQFRLHEVPERTVINTFYTHDFTKLLSISGVAREMESKREADRRFAANWEAVQDWNESRRYNLGTLEAFARGMYDAVTDNQSGILPWIRTQW